MSKEEEGKPVPKEKTVVVFKNPSIVEEKSRSKTTVNLDTASTNLSSGDAEGKWIP